MDTTQKLKYSASFHQDDTLTAHESYPFNVNQQQILTHRYLNILSFASLSHCKTLSMIISTIPKHVYSDFNLYPQGLESTISRQAYQTSNILLKELHQLLCYICIKQLNIISNMNQWTSIIKPRPNIKLIQRC